MNSQHNSQHDDGAPMQWQGKPRRSTSQADSLSTSRAPETAGSAGDDSDLLPLSTVAFAEAITPVANVGVPGRHDWVPLNQLYIDPRYQRPVLASGRKNIRRIVEGFNWSCFSPLVVAPRGPRRYAIIDGQHRAMAAATHGGVGTVPCYIITGGPDAEAKAFAIINGQVTGVTSTQIYAARVLGGEASAVALQKVCAAAGVTVIRTTCSRDTVKVGQTVAVETLETCLRKYGRDTLITALQCITETGKGNPGWIGKTTVRGLCEALHGTKWLNAGEALFAAVEKAGGIPALDARARAGWAAGGGNLYQCFVGEVRAACRKRLGAP